MPVFDTDKPFAWDSDRSTSAKSRFAYEYILDNMLTKEEIYTIRALTKLGLEYGQIAMVLSCSERTAKRHCKRATEKLKKLTRLIDFSKINKDIYFEEASEEILRKEEQVHKNKHQEDLKQETLFD